MCPVVMDEFKIIKIQNTQLKYIYGAYIEIAGKIVKPIF